MSADWLRVRTAAECELCECCEEPWCPECEMHYADCLCPGPHQEDIYDYKVIGGHLYAKERIEDEMV